MYVYIYIRRHTSFIYVYTCFVWLLCFKHLQAITKLPQHNRYTVGSRGQQPWIVDTNWLLPEEVSGASVGNLLSRQNERRTVFDAIEFICSAWIFTSRATGQPSPQKSLLSLEINQHHLSGRPSFQWCTTRLIIPVACDPWAIHIINQTLLWFHINYESPLINIHKTPLTFIDHHFIYDKP